jgi:hypothetical protein
VLPFETLSSQKQGLRQAIGLIRQLMKTLETTAAWMGLLLLGPQISRYHCCLPPDHVVTDPPLRKTWRLPGFLRGSRSRRSM